MDAESLTAAGFREYERKLHDAYDRVWYRTEKDDGGKRYMVEVRFWDFARYGAHADGWDAVVYLGQPAFCPTQVRVEVPCRDLTPEQLLRTADSICTRLGCDHLERSE